MRSVLAIAAGADGPDALPRVHNGTATVTVPWDPERVADHTGVTAIFGEPLAPTLTTVPDALVGRCWPAVFAAIGSAVTGCGCPGRGRLAEPGAPGPCRAPGWRAAQGAG